MIFINLHKEVRLPHKHYFSGKSNVQIWRDVFIMCLKLKESQYMPGFRLENLHEIHKTENLK